MKKPQALWAGIVFVLGLIFILHAQETAPPVPEGADDVSGLSDLEVELKAVEMTTPVPAADVPEIGTFWSAQHAPGTAEEWPPLPGNWLALPVWEMDTNFFLVDDLNYDYTAAKTPSATKSGGLRAMDLSGTFAPMFSVPDYSTNLWLQITNLTGNTAGILISNTEPDIEYEIQGMADLTDTNWISEGFVLGSEITNWTPASVAATNYPNLFLRVRSWADDGSGLPIWWQLQNFGTTGVDPNGDPMGDGWSNIQKFQNGMNPNVFYTPPAPQNLTLQVDGIGTNVTLSWQSGGGNVSQYKVDELLDGDTGFASTLGYASASQNSFTTSLDQPYFGTDFEAPAFRVTAQFTNGASSASTTVYLSLSSDTLPSLTAQVVRGSGGQFELTTSYLLPDVTAIRLFWVTNPFAFFTGDESDNAYYDVPASNIINGTYVLPSDVMADYVPTYPTFIETKYQSGQYDYGSGASVDTQPWVNASAYLKDNLHFLLRSATINHSFSYESNVRINPSEYFGRDETGSDYEYSSYRYNDGFGHLPVDAWRPVEENYLWRNFAYVTNDLNTGASYDTDTQKRAPDDPGFDESPEYQFSIPSDNTVPSPVLTDGTTSFFYYRSAADPNSEPEAFTEVGLDVEESTNVYLPTGVQNFYGLPIQAVKGYSGGEVDAGAPATSLGQLDDSWYVQTATASLETVGYYFACQPPVPGTPGFSSTNTSQLLIAGIGQPFTVMGWAKQAILNGYSDRFAYLEQYFDQAYQIDTNGIVTTNTTGVLSPYGQFFATEPGPVALVTMPDIDTGERGTATVYAVSLQLDANHDGNMDLSFNGVDATSQANPMRFWIDSDNDGWGVGQDIDIHTNSEADYTYGKIRSERGLEDFARLWICGMPSLPSSQGYYVTLTCSAVSGSPAINLFYAETNGGTLYLTDTNTAQSLLNQSATGTISPASPFVFPSNFFDGTNKCFMFEGAGIGEGQFTLTIFQGTTAVAQTSAYIDLHDVRDFYERAVITNNMSGVKSNWTSSVEVVQPAISSALGNDTNLIVLVHGINVNTWSCLQQGDTVFKRLYWSGFQGEFGTVKWPCNLLTPIPSPLSPAVFNESELQGYKASTALTNYLGQLRVRFPGYRLNILAHSQGNTVVSEAIKNGLTFDTYILTQGALPASAYDVNATNDPDLLGLSPSPELQPMGYLGIYTNFTGRIVNFYNPNDPVLDIWVTDQAVLKPSVYFSGSTYYYDGTNSYYDPIFASTYLVTDPEESRAMVSRSRTLPIGQTGPESPHGVIQSAVDLHAHFGFYNALPDDHSAQWTWPIQTAGGYYLQILESINP